MDKEDLVIEGVREDGAKLRPSDWIERISSTLASFGQDQRLKYSASVQPCIIGGNKCLVVARGLQTSDPAAYEYILQFAKSNQLVIKADRRYDDRALLPAVAEK